MKSQPLSGDERVKSYEAASRENHSIAHGREKSYGTTYSVPDSEWEFASCVKIREPAKKQSSRAAKNSTLLRLETRPYLRIIYPAKNPFVLGLGFAVVRDLVSFLRYTKDRRAPNPLVKARQQPASATPTGGAARRAGDFFGTLSITVSTKTSLTVKYSTPSPRTSPAAAACF